MNLEAVENTLYDITEMFFKGATIIWTEQINTQPLNIQTTLNARSKISASTELLAFTQEMQMDTMLRNSQ